MFRITKTLSSLGSNLLHPGFPLSQMRPVSRAASAIFGLPSLSGVPFLRAFGTAKLTCITENTSVTKPIMVISETGSQLGVMTKEEALKIAKERKKDLVVVHYQDSKIVCKLQVLKSVEYQRKKKDQRSEFLNRKQSQEKEVRIKGKISPHDFQIKVWKCVGSLWLAWENQWIYWEGHQGEDFLQGIRKIESEGSGWRCEVLERTVLSISSRDQAVNRHRTCVWSMVCII